MIHKIAQKMANTCCALHQISNKEKCEIITYGMEAIISTTLSVTAALIISSITGKFAECICFLFTFMPLRTYAGGYHASNYIKCFLLFMVDLFIGNIILSVGQEWYILISMCASGVALLTIWLYSPVTDANHPLSNRQRKNSRRKSIYILIMEEIVLIILLMLRQVNLCISLSYGLFSVAISMIAAKYKYYRGREVLE